MVWKCPTSFRVPSRAATQEGVDWGWYSGACVRAFSEGVIISLLPLFHMSYLRDTAIESSFPEAWCSRTEDELVDVVVGSGPAPFPSEKTCICGHNAALIF